MTAALVGILAILMIVLACAVMSLYKRGRQGASGLTLHKRACKYYQPENSSTERYVAKPSMQSNFQYYTVFCYTELKSKLEGILKRDKGQCGKVISLKYHYSLNN